jgi:MFS family permease
MTQPADADDESSGNIYNRTFWVAFIANLLLVTANTMTFRFAEFVRFLGGSEEVTGQIVAVGLIGSLFWRAFLGQAIDRFGVRRIWVFSTAVYVVGCFLIATSSNIGLQLYAGRVIFALGLASMFASALAHVQSLAPPERRTEIIGTFGASGFVGMICGAQLGDLVFHLFPDGRLLYEVLFGGTLLLGAGHGGLAIVMTSGHRHERPEVTPAAHQLFLRYWPPTVLIVTLMMGLVFSVTTVFLTRYATELGLRGVRTFFSAYAISAFSMRIAARTWSRTVGRHRLIVYGLAGHALGQLALTFVTRDWQFIPAALCFGFGHALLFPCVVSLGAGAFPEQYRGTGTTIVLAAIDIGTILTAPLLGSLIDHYGFRTMLSLVSATLAASSIIYGLISWRIVDTETKPARKTVRPALPLVTPSSTPVVDSIGPVPAIASIEPCPHGLPARAG